VEVLLPPGASPHTYEPSPSDAALVESALAVFYVDPLVDGWVLSLGGAEQISIFEMIPDEYRIEMPRHGTEHDHVVDDPHFWSSVELTAGILPAIEAELVRFDPDGNSVYSTNTYVARQEMISLNNELTELLAPYHGESLLMFHPSFNYFMHDFGLELAGVIEDSPGHEPSPRYMVELIGLIEEHNVKAIFTEPQLPREPAEMLSDETGLPVYVLDPLGGVGGRETYGELMRYNAGVLAEALGGG
jgi:ABC-type Zn uptake system ZnuABC Zn-binding protein ZnuA